MEYWTGKKKRLDQNQQYVLFERSARQALAWIKEEGDIYLSTHTQVGNTKEETEQLLVEHNSFKEKARETREKVKLLLQLADTLVEKGHAHAPNIKQWVEEVDETYKNFSTRMDKYRQKVLSRQYCNLHGAKHRNCKTLMRRNMIPSASFSFINTLVTCHR